MVLPNSRQLSSAASAIGSRAITGAWTFLNRNPVQIRSIDCVRNPFERLPRCEEFFQFLSVKPDEITVALLDYRDPFLSSQSKHADHRLLILG
jgi:hypothetical protein